MAPLAVMWMVAEVAVPPSAGLAVTVNDAGAAPASGVTPIHMGAGAPADPPSTETVKFADAPHGETTLITCEGAAPPPTNPENESVPGDASSKHVAELMLILPDPVSVNITLLDVVPAGALIE